MAESVSRVPSARINLRAISVFTHVMMHRYRTLLLH